MLRVAVILLLLALPASAAETFAGPFPARLVRVLDGDTARLEIRLWFGLVQIEDVRLAGIDAPESGRRARCAAEAMAAGRAKARLTELLGAGQLELRDVRREKFGRALARVTAAGVDVAEALVREGLVRRYGGERRGGWC